MPQFHQGSPAPPVAGAEAMNGMKRSVARSHSNQRMGSASGGSRLARTPSGKATVSRMNSKQRVTNAASARLASGESVALRDVNGNTEQVIQALQNMISDKTGNSATGAAYLRALVFDEAADAVVDHKVANARKMFDPELNISLMRAAQLPPDMRGRAEMRTIARHLGWHPFFSSVRGYLKQKLFRNIRLVSPRLGDVVVLQGDLADSIFICYHGIFAVHAATDEDLFTIRRRRDRVLAIPVASSEDAYTRSSEKKLGPRVATLKRGNSFGERGLSPAASEARNATVAAFSDDCHLFCIHREDLLGDGGVTAEMKRRRPTTFGEAGPDELLLEVLGKPANLRTQGDIELIATKCGWHAFFEGADPEATRVVFRQLKVVRAPPGRVVVLQGDLADCFYLVYWGGCSVWATPKAKALNQWKGLNLWIPEDGADDGKPRVCKLPVALRVEIKSSTRLQCARMRRFRRRLFCRASRTQ